MTSKCKRLLLAMLLAGTAGWTSLSAAQWHDRQGKAVAENESMRSLDGFSGMLLVTSDEDWEAKWNTPGETVGFTTSQVAHDGDRLFVLAVFAGFALDEAGVAHIDCSVRVLRPNGTVSTDEKGATCFEVAPQGGPKSLYLTPLVGFLGEPTDPAGTWMVTVHLHDRVGDKDLELKTSFELKR